MLAPTPASRTLVINAASSFDAARGSFDTFAAGLRSAAGMEYLTGRAGTDVLTRLREQSGQAVQLLADARAGTTLAAGAFDDTALAVGNLDAFANRMLETDRRIVFDPAMVQRQADLAALELDDLVQLLPA